MFISCPVKIHSKRKVHPGRLFMDYESYIWAESKMDVLGSKWTVKSYESGQSCMKLYGSKGLKVHGPRKWTFPKSKSGRS